MTPLTADDLTLGAEPERRPIAFPLLTPAGVSHDRSQPSGREPVVTLTRSAYDTILKTIQDDPLDHLEIGGPLIGNAIENATGTLNVFRAAGPGRNSKRSRTAFGFNGVDLDEEAGSDHCTGLWHTHPGSKPGSRYDGEMSGADIDAFTRLRDSLKRPVDRFIGIIVTEGAPPPLSRTAPRTRRRDKPKRWAHPVLTPWIIGDHWHERAQLELVTDPAAPRAARTGQRKLSLFQIEQQIGEWLRAGVSESEIHKRIDKLEAEGKIPAKAAIAEAYSGMQRPARSTPGAVVTRDTLLPIRLSEPGARR